jgi:alkanesulfonate monooxygenase SsuD/methylene tetrahydromethanopterin reductase-like flavin-dependent oxidoreductase (luciferase family)
MDISVALPNMIPGTTGEALLRWPAIAEERGFSGIAVTERLVYPGYDPLTVLAAAAARTSRIRLMTNVLIAPLRTPVELAKQAASLDQLSGGRFVLGVAPGVREDDFQAAGRDFADRVERFDRDMETMRAAWAGQVPGRLGRRVGPDPVRGNRVPVLIGGVTASAAERAARWADGWTAPGLPASRTARLADRVRAAWQRSGRDGQPRIVMLSRFMLGDDAWQAGTAFMRDYFAVLGDAAEDFVRATPRTAAEITKVIGVYADCGVDEIVFHPTTADVQQLHRLADAAL